MISLARIHYLKIHSEPYCAMMSGFKTYEIRKNDRDFRAGDILLLREWVECTPRKTDACGYTGRELRRRVTHVTYGGDYGLPRDLCVMAVVADYTTKSKG